MFKDAIEAERAERDQEADYARINAAIGLAGQNVAALQCRQLEPDEMGEKWSAIRDRTIFAIRAVRHNVIERAIKAKETERWMLERLVREESDKRVAHEFSAELKKVPTKDLVDYLRYLIQVGDRARIQGVRIMFESREDSQQYEVTFRKMLVQFALAEYGCFEERLTRICRLAEKADASLADLFCARAPHRAREQRAAEHLLAGTPRVRIGMSIPSCVLPRAEEIPGQVLLPDQGGIA